MDSNLVNANSLVVSKRFYFKNKRVIDLLLSILGLIFLSPVLLIICLIIKLESPKTPIIFKQTRIGKNGKTFTMYKFRSMVPDAELLLDTLKEENEMSGAIFKIKNDPRITKVGKFLRKTSLDEFPQLWNVIKGDMSLVGPRPPLPLEVLEYNDFHKKRLTVTPGCTGWWQVNGRSNVSFEDMVKLDIYYIRNQSLKLDFKIIFKTLKVLKGDQNAY